MWLWESEHPAFLIHWHCIEELFIDFFHREYVFVFLHYRPAIIKGCTSRAWGKNDTKRAMAEDKEIHGMVTSVINSCLGSGSIHYALILVALPPDTRQNEISSQQSPSV